MTSRQTNKGGGAKGLRLILLRHAKSAWPVGAVDEERPLNGRGRTAAPLIGAYLARKRLIPDLALVSTARRAQETWSLVGDKLPRQPETLLLPELYAASAETILAALRKVPADRRTVLILGHNPGLQDLALALSGAGSDEARNRLAAKYPTGGLAVIDFAVADWHDVGGNNGRLDRFVGPRTLG